MIRVPDLRWPVRFAWATTGLGWFIWLAYEDRSLSTVMAIAAMVCLAFALTWVSRWRGGKQTERRRWLLESMGIGLLTGALTAPAAIVLILIKTSLHAHGTPDFTAGDIAGVAQRLPVWALAGVLIGEALGLLGATLSRGE